jgi:multiple sugar transport system substrate-binding protein
VREKKELIWPSNNKALKEAIMRKKRSIVQGLMLLALAGLLVVTLTGMASAAKKFGLADIPEIKNKRPIHLAVFGGLPVAEKNVPKYVKKFSEHTGIKVTTEKMIMTSMYPKMNVELIAETGAYDGIIMEASTTNEWARFLWPIEELAEKYEPKGAAGLREYLAPIDKAMLRTTSDRQGRLMGIPYWNYEQVHAYRKDVFDDPTERANFKKRYGYELAAPTTRQQLYDQAEFFTRKKGELLKGKPLKEDLYGVGLMAGRFEINDEFSTMIWGAGGHWATLGKDENGKPKEFVITKRDKRVLKEALVWYKSLLKFASPGCLTGHWDFTTAQFADGKCIQIPFFYISLDTWAATVQDKIPGTELALTVPIGGQGYIGNMSRAVARASRNPEATYWFSKYFGSYECQKEMIEGGLSGIRRDVLDDAQYQTEKWWNSVGRRAAANTKAWDSQLPYVDGYLHFNSSAMGKIYEQQIVVMHEGAIGKLTPDECTKQMTKQTIKLQRKFGELPIREEK